MDYVYRDKPEKAETLEAGIEELIRQIPADMSKTVCQNWSQRTTHLSTPKQNIEVLKNNPLDVSITINRFYRCIRFHYTTIPTISKYSLYP